MKTRIIAGSAILLAAILLICACLAACSSTPATTGTTAATTSTTASTTTMTTTTTSTTTSASTSTTTSTTTSTSSSIVITDQTGRTVTLPDIPQKIISLSPGNTEILFALGLGDRVIGRTEYCNYPAEALDVPSIGGFSTPNVEEIVALEPDLILAANIHIAEIVPQLEGYGLNVLCLDPADISDILDAITLVGEATAAESAAQTLVNNMQNRVDAVTAKTDGLTQAEKKRVLYIIWHDPLMAAGSGTFHDELIQMAGGINIAGDLEGYPTLDMEAVIAADPEIIIAGVGMGDGEDQSLVFMQEEERLADTTARQNDAVYPMDMDIIGRPGPRIVDALEQFAAYIHPELFEEK